jgi:hypothetical protein
MAKTQITIDSSVPFGTEFRAKSGNKSGIPNHFVVIGFDNTIGDVMDYESEEVIVYDITANDVKNIPMGLTPAGTWEIIREPYSSRI